MEMMGPVTHARCSKRHKPISWHGSGKLEESGEVVLSGADDELVRLTLRRCRLAAARNESATAVAWSPDDFETFGVATCRPYAQSA
jgi:hypothetical protein